MSQYNKNLEAIARSEELALAEKAKSKKKALFFSSLIGIGTTAAILGILTLFVKFIIEESDATLIAYQAPAPAKIIQKEKPAEIPPPTEEFPIISNSETTSISIEIPEIEIDEVDLESEDFTMDVDSFSDIALEFGDSIDMTSMFGSKEIKGNSLAGHFYDLKQIKDPNTGTYIPSNLGKAFASAPAGRKGYEITIPAFYEEAKEFLLNGWDEKYLKDYYKSEDTLLTSQFLIPRMQANAAPEAFGLGDKVKPAAWLILYKGVIVAPYDCTFRFVGRADDTLMVNLNGKDVFSGSLSDPLKIIPKINDIDTKKEAIHYGAAGMRGLLKGQWIKVRKGEKMPIKIILAEVPGGGFYAHLTIEEKGVQYKQHPQGYPILPLFQTVKTAFPEEYKAGKHHWQIMDTGFIFNSVK